MNFSSLAYQCALQDTKGIVGNDSIRQRRTSQSGKHLYTTCTANIVRIWSNT